MNKKNTVREYLLNCRDEFNFLLEPVATKLDVKIKDVQNVVGELFKHGALRREKMPDGAYKYKVDKTIMAAIFLKNPIIYTSRKAPIVSTPNARNKPRPPLVMAIDAQITECEHTIKKLREFRKLFI